MAIVKLLFSELDHDRDGTLSLQELSRLAHDGDHSPRPFDDAREEEGMGLDKFKDGDHEDDVFGREMKAIRSLRSQNATNDNAQQKATYPLLLRPRR